VTIILSLVTGEYAVQVSDRLLTRKWTTPRVRYEPWDEAANKSVIVLGRDGLFSLGYSGPGHIADAPTDSWIAEVVAGEELGADQIRPDFGAMQISQGTSTDRVLATRFPELARRIDEAGRAGQLTQPLSIGFVGIRWKDLNKLAWPAYGRIGWDEDQARYGYEMSPQRWGYGEGKFVTGATGPSRNVAQKLLRERFSGTDLSNKEDTAAAMIEILRELPEEDPTVGRDCLVTTIQGVPPHVRIKYEPFGSTQMVVESASGQAITVEAAVSPWIITPNHLIAPLAMNMPVLGPFSSSGFDFVIEGPDSTSDDLLIMSSQPRRLFPEPGT
jgi:hypothetical protein